VGGRYVVADVDQHRFQEFDPIRERLHVRFGGRTRPSVSSAWPRSVVHTVFARPAAAHNRLHFAGIAHTLIDPAASRTLMVSAGECESKGWRRSHLGSASPAQSTSSRCAIAPDATLCGSFAVLCIVWPGHCANHTNDVGRRMTRSLCSVGEWCHRWR